MRRCWPQISIPFFQRQSANSVRKLRLGELRLTANPLDDGIYPIDRNVLVNDATEASECESCRTAHIFFLSFCPYLH
ncbi:hypothetical protein PsorP6_002720 [Peronosclerospora sorghi]|uniref:Uncharacterized protein n=1 Tax=Peronosclerospora sorghi TaxID=230839 RepID=A0ACC0WUA0_9STRA|nr:hypothetical protein PsorP6_002720 [Peronosclerospora sorghi]